jgi:hypothetical protein
MGHRPLPRPILVVSVFEFRALADKLLFPLVPVVLSASASIRAVIGNRTRLVVGVATGVLAFASLTLVEFAVDHGMYPYKFYKDYCPFMQPLRSLPEFERIVTKAAKRVAEFS